MAVAKIDKYPILGSSEVTWPLKSGVRPVMQTFDMAPGDAANLQAMGNKTVSLITDAGSISGLYVLYVGAGDNPYIRRVTLADRRWIWPYKHVRRYFNIRRNIGVRRAVDPSAALEVIPVVGTVAYQSWSLKDTTPGLDASAAKWVAHEAFEEVLNAVLSKEKEWSKNVASVTGLSAIRTLNRLSIENLIINDAGDSAIQRMLAYLPKFDLYINFDGAVVIYDKTDGSELSMLEAGGARMAGQGDAVSVDNANIRPSKMRVYFNYEPEIRIDFDERATDVTHDTRYMQNVLPIPDFSLEVDGETEAQGTYITFDQAFAAWGTPPAGLSGPLTHSYVQKALVPYMGLLAGLEIAGAFTPDADWAARIGALQQHYRRTFKIQRHIMDKISGLKPYRVATVNVATGTRAPAIAYTDYCYLTGQRALFNEARSASRPKSFSYAVNVKGHPARSFAPNNSGGFDSVSESASLPIDEDSKSSPFDVRIIDSDQGVIHLEPNLDPFRLFDSVLPSMMTIEGRESEVDDLGRPIVSGPTADITNRGVSISFDTVGKSHPGSFSKLTANHKVSIILTIIPGAPNDERALYCVEVSPGELSGVLPPNAMQGGSGPIMDIYIGAGIETARVKWDDAKATLIDQIIGIGGDENEDAVAFSEKIKGLVLNDGATGPSGASLQEISRAAAARIYASLVNRVQGEVAVNMNLGLHPTGWLSEVSHTLTQQGVAMTKMSFPEQIRPIDIFSLLDSSTRAIILKLAAPDRSVA